jgi:hypothetical protein
MTTITIDCKNKNIYDIIEWCNDQFGADRWNWRSQFPSHRYDFVLPTEQAAMHFRLKWQ